MADLFEREGYKYLAYADRLTGYAELAHFPSSTVSSVIINIFREYFHRWSVPEEVSLDGGPNLASKEISDWLDNWGVNWRRSSAYYPQSNGRAEAAVKSLKRLLMGNTGRSGSIDTDNVAKALMQYRNTPLRGIDRSPAELALGRNLKDAVPLPRARYAVNENWAATLRRREKEMSRSNQVIKLKYDRDAKELSDLPPKASVLCQDPRSGKWGKSGVVAEACGHRQYYVRMDGSGRLTLRNRRHLRPVLVHHPVTPQLHKGDSVPDKSKKNDNGQPPADVTDNASELHEQTKSSFAQGPSQWTPPPPEKGAAASGSPPPSTVSAPSGEDPPVLRRSNRIRQKPLRYR